jgi:hypothetical protein
MKHALYHLFQFAIIFIAMKIYPEHIFYMFAAYWVGGIMFGIWDNFIID